MREVIDQDMDDMPPPMMPEVPSKPADVPDKKERTPATRETKAMGELRNNEDRNLKDWLEEMSPGGAVRVKVTRLSPKVSKSGLNVGGILATYEHQIDEKWISEHHGGGDFRLLVQKPRTNGSGWVYAGQKDISIAGDPRTDDVFRDKSAGDQPAAAAGPAGKLVEQAYGVLERQLEREQQRQRQPVSQGPDAATIQMLLAPMQQQVDQLANMLREKDRQLTIAQQTKPEQDPFRDKMIATLLDGDTARITALRAQYESELRQVKQSAIDNEARLRDGFDRDKQSLAMAHDRELKSLAGAHAMTVAAKDQSEATSRMLLEAEIRRVSTDLVEAKTELIALRAKKDKTIIEQATEFAQIKEAIGEITGDSEPTKPSTIDKVLEYAGNLPVVQNAIARAAGGEPTPPPAPPPPPQPRPRRPPPQLRHFAGPDGNLYRKQPDGTMELEAARPPGQPAIPQIPPATVKLAVDFLEAACRNGQDPAEVATSVRSMIPADVLTAIRELGIDGFLSTLAKLDGTSPLSSQAGRNWTRKLGKALVGE